jgi:glycosyltransferase involved in cell wall biosynthesis
MTTDTAGGVFQYTLELASGLAARGTDVFIAAMGGPLLPMHRRALERVPCARVFEGRFRLEWMVDPWEDVERAGQWLLGIANEVEPDVVHLNGYGHAPLPWRCPVVVVAHSCVLSWWRAVRRSAPSRGHGHYANLVSAGIERADEVIAPSHAMLDALHANYRTSRGVVIHNGRSPDEFVPSPKHPFILSLGRTWDEAKNLGAVDRAARNLQWPVFVGGQSNIRGPAPPFEHASYLGMLGPTALRAVLSRASIYAHPARYEPFGLSVLEAALSGCALVLGHIPSLVEIWGDSAIYVDPDDTNGLGWELDRLAHHHELRAEMASRARARGLRYSAARMLSAYLEVYQRIMRRPGNPRAEHGAACA